MPYFDIILIIIIALFAFTGFWFGFLHTVGALIGTFIGAAVASRTFEQAGTWLRGYFDISENLSLIFGFLLVYFVVARAFGLIVWLLEKIIKVSRFIPLFGLLNRLAGALVGIAEGVLIVGLTLTFATKFPINAKFLTRIDESKTAAALTQGSKILLPVLSEKVKKVKMLIDTVQQ